MPAKKTSTVIEVFGKIIVPLITALIGAGMTYFVTTYEKAPPPQTEVAIESIPMHVFAFAGNNNPDGGWSAFDVYYKENKEIIYNFLYSLPTDGQSGYAGLAFNFDHSVDLSEFESLSFLLIIPPTEEVDLVIKDISGVEQRYRLRGGLTETQMNIALSNFKGVNLKAVQEVVFFADTGFITGDHSLSVTDIYFKR